MWISTAMLMIVLATGSLADREEVSSQTLRSFPESEEPQDNRAHVQQCRATNLFKKHLGYVNVFAFLNPSWYYSFRQAIMLEMLKKRFEKAGYRNILFFVVTPPAGLSDDAAEDSMEVKAWKEISKNILVPEYFWGAEEAVNDLAKTSEQGVIFLQDSPEFSIWKSFRASKDEVVVVDRCGKLSYQIIVPWSILYFPYVKAAILSTYKEDPCGPCDEQPPAVRNSTDYDDYTRGVQPDEKEVDKHLDPYTSQTPTNLDSESVTMPSEKPDETEDDKNTSNIIHFDLNLNANRTATPNSTKTDAPFVETEMLRTYSELGGIDRVGETTSMENIRNDENMNTTSVYDNIESTSEVSLQQTQIRGSPVASGLETPEERTVAQDREPTTVNKDNQFLAITDRNTAVTSGRDDGQNAMDGSLKNMEEKEEISSVDHEASNGDTEDKERQVQRGESLPLRIILYAPHLHQEGQNLKQYTHLVLKAGNPDYHGHFHSTSTIGYQKPATLESLDPAKLGNKKLDVYMNGVNESPGVYGEIADYWINSEEEEFNKEIENTEFLEYNDITVDAEGDVENTFDDESTILKAGDIGGTNSDAEINDNSDDLAQHKLIKHYYKLVPWIDYVL